MSNIAKIVHIGLDVGNANTSVTVKCGAQKNDQISPGEDGNEDILPYPTIVYSNADGDDLSAIQVIPLCSIPLTRWRDTWRWLRRRTITRYGLWDSSPSWDLPPLKQSIQTSERTFAHVGLSLCWILKVASRSSCRWERGKGGGGPMQTCQLNRLNSNLKCTLTSPDMTGFQAR